MKKIAVIIVTICFSGFGLAQNALTAGDHFAKINGIQIHKVSQADRIAKNIPSSTEIVIKDAEHFCWFEQPKQFFDNCENWLQKQGLKNNKVN